MPGMRMIPVSAAACIAVLALFSAAWAVPTLDTTPDGTASITHETGTTVDLPSPQDVALLSSGDKTYALVIDGFRGTVSAFDITDPDDSQYLWSKKHLQNDGSGEYGLLKPVDIDTVTIGMKTYAVVTSSGGLSVSCQINCPRDSRVMYDSTQYTGGLQIIDVTDPSSPAFVKYINQGDSDTDGNEFSALAGAGGSAIFESNSKTYVVTGGDEGMFSYGGMQVSDITDPADPKAVSHVHTADDFGTDQEHSNLEGHRNDVAVVPVNGVPHALMTASGTVTPGSSTMTGSLTVISLADPSAPAHVSTVKVGDADSDGREFDVLFRPSYVAAAAVGGTPYAVVSASTRDGSRDGLQVVDLSDPQNPKAASSMIDGVGFEALAGARDMHFDSIGGKTYLFAPSYADSTVSIIDFADPSAPSEVSWLQDGLADSIGARCGELEGASGVDTITVGGKTYAAITAEDDSGVQILDVSAPSDPRVSGVILDGTFGYLALTQPYHVEAVDVGARSYIVVTNYHVGGDGKVQIIDVTDPSAPEAASTVFNKADARPPQFGSNADLIMMEGLGRPRGLDSFTHTLDGQERTYVIVASDDRHWGSFVVMDITDPTAPTHASTGWDKSADQNHPGFESPFEGLNRASDVAVYEVGSDRYAIITALVGPSAVQIVNLNDPYNPKSAAYKKNGDDDSQTPTPTKFKFIKPYGVDTFTIASGTNAGTYAAVAVKGANRGDVVANTGVQIIKVDDPDKLVASPFVADTDAVRTDLGFSYPCAVCLKGSNQVKAVDIDVSGTPTPHLLVTSLFENGLQLIDVSNPASPTMHLGVRGGFNPNYDGAGVHNIFGLGGSYGVDTFTIGTSLYAAVTGSADGDVQIVGFDSQRRPLPSAFVSDGQNSEIAELQGARGVATFALKDGWTYAAVAAFGTRDDPDTGLQILRLGGEADSSAPVLQSAVLVDDKVLELTFDDVIDVSAADLTKLAVSESGRSNQHVLETGMEAATLETESDDVTLRIRLTSAQEASVKALATKQLDIEAGAVQNTNSQAIAVSHDNAITAKTTVPVFRGAVLDLSSGVLVITFSQEVDLSSADPAKMLLHKGGDKQRLTGSDTLTSINRSLASLKFSEENRQVAISTATSARQGETLRLDFEAGALSGSSGASLGALADRPVRVLPDDRNPLLVSAVIDAGVLRIAFDETIDYERVDLSKLSLESGGGERALTGSALLTSQDSPEIRVRLDADAAGVAAAGATVLDIDHEAVWDTAGNHVLRDEGNAIGQPPRLVSAEATSRGTVVAELTKPVAGTGQLHSAWRLHGPDAQGLSFASAAIDGNSVTLRLGTGFAHTAPDVQLEYVANQAPLTDQDGRELAAGRVAVSDRIPPELASAIASSLTSVEVTFTEQVSGVAPDGAGWSVSGPDAAGRTVTAAAPAQDSAVLTLSGPLADTSPSVSLRYDPAGSVQDAASNVMPVSSLESVEDRIAPEFVSASLQGTLSFLVTYSEDVESEATHYASISSGTSTVRAESVVGSPGSSILVVIDPSSATFSAGTAITFTILPAVADLAGNSLSNAGQFQIPASETAKVARLVLSNPGNDGRSNLSLTDDTLVRTVVVQRGTGVDLDVSSLTGVEAAHPRVSGAGGGAAVFPSDLAVRVASGTVTFPSGLQVGGLDADAEMIRVGTAPAAELPAEFASSVRLDTARAATVLELGDPSRTLWFSEPVRIDLAEPLSEIVYVIRPDGARQVLSCGTEVGTPDRAESAIAALAQSTSADADSCFSGERAIWTRSFSLWGSGPVLPPEPVTPEPVVPPVTPEPEPEPEPEPAPSETIRRGGGGGGGGGSLRGPASAGPSDSAYVATVSWDCSASLVTVTAGPDSDGLSVSIISSVLGSMQAQEDPSARQGGLRTFTAPMSANEDFLQVTAMHISARDFVQDRRSVNLDQCVGSQTFWTPPRASAQQGTAAQTAEPETETEAVPDPEPEQQRQDREPQVQQCPAGTVMGADGRCSAPEEPLVSEPPTAQVQPVECGPGTQMGPDGTCTVIPAETGDQNGCLVATAAHGTELAPAVQKLREIRDGALSSTGAGSAFMSAFNSAYYAFSPAVADLERQSPAFRDIVRASIAPMIHSLQIMEAAESEAQVAAYGLAVVALNLGMYAGIPAAAVLAGRRALRRGALCPR